MSTKFTKILAVVALVASFAVVAPKANAAMSASDLQAQINALMAQLSALGGGSCAATYNHTMTLKVGSKGSQVSAMQAVIGATADGSFGPMTKTKVMAFQASKGLTADGVVGAMTGAALHSASMTGCSSSDDDDSSSNGDLSGSFGTVSDVNVLSQYSNEEIGEGESDVKVLGADIEASNDGDIKLNSIKISFDPSGNGGSTRLNKYIDGVTVWLGDKEVGSADVEDFTKGSSDIYSRTIALSGAVIRADKTAKLYVSVDGANTLDSGDIGSDSWSIDLDNVRYEDGSGVVTTDTSTGDIGSFNVAMDFVTFSTSADTELKISTASDSPEAGIVVVDDQDNTDNVSLLKGKLKLEGSSDALLDEFPVTLTTTLSTRLVDVTGSLTLVIDGEEYTESVTSTTTSATVVFDNMDFDLSAGDTVEFEVMADVNDIDVGTFEEGDNLKADVTSTNRAAMNVENEEGDQLSDSSEKSGTTVGEYQEFRTQGIAVTLVDTSSESSNDTGSLNDTGTFTIKFKVTAVGDDAYLATTVAAGFTYTADIAGTATTVGVSAVVVNNTDTDQTAGNNWLIEEGSSETLTLTVSKVNSAGVANAGLTRANLTGVKWDSDDTGSSTPANTYSSNMDDFHTAYIALN